MGRRGWKMCLQVWAQRLPSRSRCCVSKREAKAHPWVACHTACGAEGWVHSVGGQNYNFSGSSANHRLLPPYAWLPMSESSSGQGEGHRGRVEGRAPPGLVLRLVYVAA